MLGNDERAKMSPVLTRWVGAYMLAAQMVGITLSALFLAWTDWDQVKLLSAHTIILAVILVYAYWLKGALPLFVRMVRTGREG